MYRKKIIVPAFTMLFIFILSATSFASTSLQFGSRGTQVSNLQRALKNSGHYNYSITGIYGKITEQAVIDFQKSNRLRIDGIANQQTQSRLFGSSYSTLRFGSRGSNVSNLQQGLKNAGYYNYSVTGFYGKITEQAVIDFQRSNRLRIDGIAGPQTQSALYNGSSTNNTASNVSQSSSDLYWLSRIIHAEARGEPYTGMVAVGNVVLNRVNSTNFPNTVYGVIFEYYKHIPQFSPVEEGTIYNTPSAQSVRAARDALNGARPVGNAEYFFNPRKASGAWIVNNRTYLTRIGEHVFYR